MSQVRFIKFKDPVNSLPLNEKWVGIIPSTVYCGFDNIIDGSGLTFKLNHEITGEVFTNQNLVVTPKRGVWVTRQGVVIKEDAPIPVALDSNNGNNSIRYDLLIGRHNHDVIYPGGIAASYEIVKGGSNNPIQPAIPNPETGTLIGVFEIQPNAQSFNNVKFIRARVPGLGNKQNARIDELNRFIAQQQFYQVTGIKNITDNATSGEAKRVLSNLSEGNSFIIDGGGTLDSIENLPDGTELNLIFNNSVTIKPFFKQLVGGSNGLGERVLYNAGYRPIVVGNTLTDDLVIPKGDLVKLVKVSTGTNFDGTNNPIYGDYWKVISVGSSPLKVQLLESDNIIIKQEIITIKDALATLGAVRPYQILEIYLPDVSAHYVTTGASNTWGLAKEDSIWKGTAICNGNNGTPDKRAKFQVGYDKDALDYNTPGKTGGVNKFKLSLLNLPKFRLSFWVNRAGGGWRTTGGSGQPVTGVGGFGFTTDAGGNGYTSYIGQDVPNDIDNRPNFQVCLYVMVLPVAS